MLQTYKNKKEVFLTLLVNDEKNYKNKAFSCRYSLILLRKTKQTEALQSISR